MGMSARASYWIVVTLAAATFGCPPAIASTSAFPTETASLSTAEFVDSIGVNTHTTYGNSNPYNYGNPTLVEQALKYAGIRHIRDGISSGFSDKSWAYTAVVENQLAKDGYKFNFATSALASYVTLSLDAFAKEYPEAIELIEGPNEINSWPVATTLAFQKALYDWVHSDPNLKGVAVLDFTLAYASDAVYKPYGNVSAYANDGNAHIYAPYGMPPTYDWNGMLQASQTITPKLPMVVTETGYPTLPTFVSGVDQPTQAKYILDALMDAASTGVKRTYIYELLDRKIPDASSPDQGYFGLFNPDGTPKPSATALHNLNNCLLTGATASVALGKLELKIGTLPKQGHALLMQKAPNVFDLVLWAEPTIWNYAKHEPVLYPWQMVTLTLASVTKAKVFDPIQDEIIQSSTNPSEISVGVVDHPVVVEMDTSP